MGWGANSPSRVYIMVTIKADETAANRILGDCLSYYVDSVIPPSHGPRHTDAPFKTIHLQEYPRPKSILCNRVHYRLIYSKRDGGWRLEPCFSVWQHVLRVGKKWCNSISLLKRRPRDWLHAKKQLDELKSTQTCIPSSTYDLLQTCITTNSHHHTAHFQ